MRALFTKAALDGATTDGEEYDFWNEAETRAQYRIDLMAGLIKRDGITTGITDLDKELYHHGWGRRELSLWMGAAKAGKSMSLGFFAKQASLAGFNVLYASCEVSRAIISERIEADVSDTIIKLVGDNPHAVLAAVQKARKGAGQFKIHEYASGGLKPSELRRLIERYRMKGVVFDLIAVDYADIMAPERTNDSQIENMRTIYVDLRGIAFDYNVAMLTATQTNREGAKKAVAKMTDVAEDFNKIRTADIVLSINATEPERLAGECRIFFAASRNSEDGFVIRVKQDRSRMRFISKVIGKEAA
jgi:replicative DNA helicase